MSKIPKERTEAIGLPPLADIDREMLRRLLDPESGVPLEERAVLRTKLGLPAEAPVLPEAPGPPTATNAPPQKISASK